MRKRLPLSQLQKTILLIAANDSNGECHYKPLRQCFSYSKSTISRSARRLERAGLGERFTHAINITEHGRQFVRGRTSRADVNWMLAALSVPLYYEALDQITRARLRKIMPDIFR